jgi:hypothetical protein
MSVVYFVAGGTCIKIGISTNIKSRFASLQTSSGEDLRLLATIPGGIALEREIHARLDGYRKRGEWFLDCAEVRAAIVDLCGENVFEAVEEPPQPSPPRPLRDILDDAFEATKLRFSSFFNFCLEDSSTNKSCKIWRLHVTKRHLIIAAIRYAHQGIEREESNLAVNPDDFEAAGRAAAFAECCECHVEMILGRDTWFLDGWVREPRVNPLFETMNGEPRWRTIDEARAAGWVAPTNKLHEEIRAA